MHTAVSFRTLLAAAAIFAAPAAQAQSLAPASGTGFAKSEAILGGPSRLAAIMAAQSAGTPVQPAAFLAPAALSQRPAASLLVREAPTITLRRASAPVSADRPDVFNSIALPVGHTSLDRRWAAIARAGIGGEAARVAASWRHRDEYARLDAINRYVNAHVDFVDDRARFGVADRWSPASETLGNGRGDCEDFAIAKRAMLRAAGFADRDLYLVVLKDLVRRADHAVLVVRSAGRFLVLDNGTDRLIDSADITDYRPVLTFTAGQAFTHGYRRDAITAPVQYAMAENPAVPVPAAAPTMAEVASAIDLPLTLASTNFRLLPAALTLALLR